MNTEVETISRSQKDEGARVKPEVNRYERNRLIAHLGKTFARRYDIQVLPSRQKGVWACGLDPKVTPELERYIRGDRETLDDLPPESFTPKRILYDEQAALEMSMEQITTILHHEAGHAKYTDFRSMIEGQRQAKDEGYLPTSFWLAFEGFEDPRVNSLEGEESPAIDRQIRTNQGNDLQTRLTEAPLSQKPKMLQFAYNSFHRWLHDDGIPELRDTDVGKATELASPLLEQYFQNTDIEQRRILQKQIWDIAKELEPKEIQQEEMRQMEKRKGKSQGGGQGEGQAQGGQGEETQGIPDQQQAGVPGQQKPLDRERQKKNFLERLRNAILGRKDKPKDEEQKTEAEKQKPEKFDLSQLSPEEFQQIKDAIDQLSPKEREELTKQAREAVDEAQKEALEEEFLKTFKLEKNKETGEYEAIPQLADEKMQKEAEENYQQAVEKADAEEQAGLDRLEAERKKQEEIRKQQEAARREKLEMEKAGFNEDEREKFLLYQSLEDSMYGHVRNFKQAIENVIPRRKEPVYEGDYFSGHKFDRRTLIKRAPLGNEQFWQRQVDRPTGNPRLFIGLLVDNSGSMAGKKIEEARKTMIFFAKVCKDLNIPFMEGAFGSKADVIKQFNQDFDDGSQRIKPKLIDFTNANASSTNMHAGLEVTIEAMNEQQRRLRDSHGLIFVMTDGGANAGLTGDRLRDYIEENRGRLTFKGFGLSGNSSERSQIQNYLNFYFGEGNCAYPEGFEDLPDEAFRVLRVNLMQFQRFLT